MEDTLGDISELANANNLEVLILVLMEDTLGAIIYLLALFVLRLNPCFNGRYSRRLLLLISIIKLKS